MNSTAYGIGNRGVKAIIVKRCRAKRPTEVKKYYPKNEKHKSEPEKSRE